MVCAFVVGSIALNACGATERSPAGVAGNGGDTSSNGGAIAGASGGAGAGGATIAGGGTTISTSSGGSIIEIHLGGAPTGDHACSQGGGGIGGIAPLFCGHDIENAASAARELYSWTTLEQASELRAGGELFTRSERPGMGPGYAFTYMTALAARVTGAMATILNGVLSSFDKGRYAWPHPWATRMGWPGEDYGDQLLRIRLKPEAWVLIVREQTDVSVGDPIVRDMNNNEIPLAEAAKALDRIGAIYFVKTDVNGRGSFAQCGGGYREFIIGNLAMIEEWSLGTDDIRARIEADATLIDAFRLEIEPAPPVIDATTFNRAVACNWDAVTSSNLERYERALAIPSENYLPTPTTLATLRDTLRASLFVPDPLVVKPSQ